MALVLKPGKTFIDSNTGIELSTVYAKINRTEIVNSPRGVSFYLLYYSSKEARLGGKNEFTARQFTVNQEAIESFEQIQLPPGTTQINLFNAGLTQFYLYLLSLQDDEGNLVFEDWEGDQEPFE